MNFLPARVGEGGRRLHLPGGIDVPVPPRRLDECVRHAGREVMFGLRPEHIGIGARGDAGVATVEGRVLLVEPLGSDTLALIRLGGAADAGEVTGRFPPDAGLRARQSLPVALSLDHLHLLDHESGAAIRGTAH
jgi:multiple sugar transport system ATP-binding protein